MIVKTIRSFHPLCSGVHVRMYVFGVGKRMTFGGFLAILSYCNHRVRLLESVPTMYRSKGRSRGRDRPNSAELPRKCGLAG